MNGRIALTVAGLAVVAIGVTQVTTIAGTAGERNGLQTSDQRLAGNERGGIDPQESSTGVPSEGADVVLTDIHQVNQYGPVGSIHAYSIGSHTCNIGDEPLAWVNNGPPGLAMNAYRLHEGRLMQIGQSWVKHACCAVNFGNCGGLSCNWISSSQLGTGCLDIYSASWNANQSRLGPRSGINAHTGEFSPISGSGSDAVDRRLQVHADDLDLSVYGDALYFVEGVYVATDDAQAGNSGNNATYRRANLQSNKNLNPVGDPFVTIPAIYAWTDHGNGPNNPDFSVEIRGVDVPNEGTFYLGSNVIDNKDGTWRYEYAAYNLNSHRSGGSFSVPVASDVNVTDIGFHSPFYHSGEPYDNSPWTASVNQDEIVWQSPETYAQNPDSNALRWGTMYNFWFIADVPPKDGTVTLGLFIPDDDGPDSVSMFLQVPDSDIDPGCIGDLTGDGNVGVPDLLVMINSWGACKDPKDCPADLTGSGHVGVEDLLILIGNWGACD